MNAALPDLELPIAQAEILLTAAFQIAAVERQALVTWRADSLAASAYLELALELA